MPAAAAIAAALVLAAPSGAADPVRDESGSDDSIPAVILVSGDDAHVVDALTAVPLAGHLDVPIIHTGPGDDTTGETLTDIRALHPPRSSPSAEPTWSPTTSSGSPAS